MMSIAWLLEQQQVCRKAWCCTCASHGLQGALLEQLQQLPAREEPRSVAGAQKLVPAEAARVEVGSVERDGATLLVGVEDPVARDRDGVLIVLVPRSVD